MSSERHYDYETIPMHIFTNKECTITPNKELREYLEYMLEHHEHDLEYLWRYSQQYVHHGGCYVLSFPRWVDKLTRDLVKQRE